MITKKQAADILGIHVKTMERYCEDSEFRDRAGYRKNGINGRVFFDEETFRSYAAGQTGDQDLRQAGAVTDKPEQTGLVRDWTANNAGPMIAPAAVQPVPVSDRLAAADPLAEIKAALLTPHKFLFTLAEARDMTGIPASQLHKLSELIGGRRLIRRDKLLGLSKGRKLI